MSALVITASPLARSAAPSPRGAGGSAEDFAAAIRDAAPDARAHTASSAQPSTASAEGAGAADSSHPFSGEMSDQAPLGTPPAHLGVRDGAASAGAERPVHDDDATALVGSALPSASPLVQADGADGLATAHSHAGMQVAANGSVATAAEATTPSAPPTAQELGARIPSASDTMMPGVVAQGDPRQAPGAVATQPSSATASAAAQPSSAVQASSVVVSEGARGASPTAATSDAPTRTTGPTMNGSQAVLRAEGVPGAQSIPDAAGSTAARPTPNATSPAEAPHPQRSAEIPGLAPQPTAPSAPIATSNTVEATAAGSPRPALLPQLAAPVVALARSPQGQHSITLTVSPENLGPVTVRAHITGAGIRLELHSPSDAGREALRVILADLRRDLAIAAPGASVDVSSRDASSGSSPDPHGRSETQARSDQQGRPETQGRSEPEPRGGRHSGRPIDAGAPPGSAPASVADIPVPAPPHSPAQTRIDVYA